MWYYRIIYVILVSVLKPLLYSVVLITKLLISQFFLKTVFCVVERLTMGERHERADSPWGAGTLRGPCHEGETTLIPAIFGPTVKCSADTQTQTNKRCSAVIY